MATNPTPIRDRFTLSILEYFLVHDQGSYTNLRETDDCSDRLFYKIIDSLIEQQIIFRETKHKPLKLKYVLLNRKKAEKLLKRLWKSQDKNKKI